MKTPVKYIAPVLDSSGYSQAARQNIAAMARSGIDMTVFPISFEQEYTSHGQLTQLVNQYVNKPLDHKVQIIHSTPENWPQFIKHDKYNIGYTTWETNKLPADWPGLINQVQEVWVPSQFNKQVFIESGVTKPIYVVPHPADKNLQDNSVGAKIEAYKDSWKFYSICQWHERKNPVGLLTAYLSEFSDRDKVCLILKTYLIGWNMAQQNVIKGYIKQIKHSIGRQDLPPIVFVGDLLTDMDVYGIHKSADCLVLPHRGEGWGYPLQEAMLFGNPVITTNWSGNTEFTKPEFSYLIDYSLVPVGNMPWGKYTPDQKWAQPSIASLREQMRHVYENQQEAKDKGKVAQEYMKNNFSYESVGSLIAARLKEIYNAL